jgi:hypothetical protein
MKFIVNPTYNFRNYLLHLQIRIRFLNANL